MSVNPQLGMEVVFLDPPFLCELMECVRPAILEASAADISLCCITSHSPRCQHRVILKAVLSPSCDPNAVIVSSWIQQILLRDNCQAQWLPSVSTPFPFKFRLRYLAHISHLNWDEIGSSFGFLDPRALQMVWPIHLDVKIATLMIQRILPQHIPCMQNSLMAFDIFDMTMVS